LEKDVLTQTDYELEKRALASPKTSTDWSAKAHDYLLHTYLLNELKTYVISEEAYNKLKQFIVNALGDQLSDNFILLSQSLYFNYLNLTSLGSVKAYPRNIITLAEELIRE